MTLPASGPLSLSAIYYELNGSYPLVNSNIGFRSMSLTAGKSVPDNISEFYGYSSEYSIYVYGQYVDSVDSNTDYISGGSIRLKTYPGGSTLQTWIITPTGSDVISFYHEFVGIPGGQVVTIESLGVSITYNTVPVPSEVLWGIDSTPFNTGSITDPISSQATVNFDYLIQI